jgi:hypothetical protein
MAEVEALFTNAAAEGSFDVLEQTTDELFIHGDVAYEFGRLEQTHTRDGGKGSSIDTSTPRQRSVCGRSWAGVISPTGGSNRK